MEICLRGRARQKTKEILINLNGTVSIPQRSLLKRQLAHLQDIQDNLVEVEQDILVSFSHFEGPIDLLDSIPGIEVTTAHAIVAEIGVEMSAFPTVQHICSWAGLAPGNHQSAGKKKRQRVNHGNNYLKTTLCEIAWVLTRQKDTYLSGWYRRLKQRKGTKRAIVALARKLLVIIYTMLKTKQHYDEQRFVERNQINEQRRVNRMMSGLSKLGYTVSIAS